MTLYELTEQYRSLLELAEDPDTDPEVFADTLEGLTGEIEDKAEGYACVMRSLEADAAALRLEEKRLASRRQTIEKNMERMKQTLETAMRATGKTKFKTRLFSFGIQRNAPHVVIDAASVRDFPDAYVIESEPVLDKTAIRDALKAGEDLSGLAHLEQSESLRIR